MSTHTLLGRGYFLDCAVVLPIWRQEGTAKTSMDAMMMPSSLIDTIEVAVMMSMARRRMI